MQNFKTFISEKNDDSMESLYIEVDEKTLENNKDMINSYFDRLVATPYTNPVVFYDQVRATLERYGMIVPPHATKHFLNFDAEMVFKLGSSPYFLYVVYNTKPNKRIDGYAQIVDDEELEHLMDDDDMPNSDDDASESELESDDDDDMEDYGMRRRKMDYDSGNTGEY